VVVKFKTTPVSSLANTKTHFTSETLISGFWNPTAGSFDFIFSAKVAVLLFLAVVLDRIMVAVVRLRSLIR
jgi:hypothetical protein